MIQCTRSGTEDVIQVPIRDVVDRFHYFPFASVLFNSVSWFEWMFLDLMCNDHG